MGFFGPTKKHVSKNEMKDVRARLYANGFDETDIHFVEVVFRADLDEHEPEQAGIDEAEITSAISWLRHHPHHHHLSDTKLSTLEKVLRGEL